MTPEPNEIDWHFAVTVSIPALVAVAGWFFVHRLNARRELIVRKREARLKSLEAAFMRIATSSNRPQMTDKMKDDLETFVSEIQLYGTPKQIELMTGIVEGFKKPGNVSYDEILANLRNSIRQELNLEPVSGEVWWVRFNRDEATSTAGKLSTN